MNQLKAHWKNYSASSEKCILLASINESVTIFGQHKVCYEIQLDGFLKVKPFAVVRFRVKIEALKHPGVKHHIHYKRKKNFIWTLIKFDHDSLFSVRVYKVYFGNFSNLPLLVGTETHSGIFSLFYITLTIEMNFHSN